MIFDNDFLLKLDKERRKVIYARITALRFDESPIETIEGRVTQGSINVDGSSAIRRTCSLTLTTKDFRYNNYYWSLHTKFKLEIGIENNINSNYPNIIWFNQGTYLITSFNSSLTSNNFTIQIQGKDKMTLLNGEIGGVINAPTDFGSIDEENENGEWVNRKISIYEIIREAVHVYAKEPYYNIIIKDLDIQGLELLEYRDKENPLYLCRKKDEMIYDKYFKDGNTVCFVYFAKHNIDGTIDPGSFIKRTTLNKLETVDLDILIDPELGTDYPKLIQFKNDAEYYFVSKIEYGQSAGYRNTDLTFPKDLIGNVGETIVSIFDKIIKTMLTDYEYFYNLDGQFVFQKKQIYINTPWTPIKQSNNEFYVDSIMNSTQYSYFFNGADLINSFSNNPNISNLKNDYSIHGKKRSTSGIDIPILMRYAIDQKPEQYTCIEIEDNDQDLIEYNKKNNLNCKGQKKYTYSIDKYDWREIIYQMASDYYKYGQLDDFNLKVVSANGDLYPNGITGYEQYYTDIKSFWRELYNPYITYNLYKKNEIIKEKESQLKNTSDEEEIKILQEQIDKEKNELVDHYNYYCYMYNFNGDIRYENKIIEDLYTEQHKTIYNSNKKRIYSKSLFPKEIPGIPVFEREVATPLFDENSRKKIYNNYKEDIIIISSSIEAPQVDLNEKNVYAKGVKVKYSDSNIYWNKTVYENPENLNFWFDFLNTGELQNFNVQTVGMRAKAVNDSEVKAIYFRDTPEIIFINENENEGQMGYKYIRYDKIDEDFSISDQGKSAKNKLDELLYQHGCVTENATITTIPIYYLQPNTRIHIHDEKTNINGDYIINKLTIPLAYNGNMSITATKVIENFK